LAKMFSRARGNLGFTFVAGVASDRKMPSKIRATVAPGKGSRFSGDAIHQRLAFEQLHSDKRPADSSTHIAHLS
jgi:hypothetical protein